jgi:hypothetical protein
MLGCAGLRVLTVIPLLLVAARLNAGAGLMSLLVLIMGGTNG